MYTVTLTIFSTVFKCVYCQRYTLTNHVMDKINGTPMGKCHIHLPPPPLSNVDNKLFVFLNIAWGEGGILFLLVKNDVFQKWQGRMSCEVSKHDFFD